MTKQATEGDDREHINARLEEMVDADLLAKLTGLQVKVLVVLFRHGNYFTYEAYPSLQTIARRVGDRNTGRVGAAVLALEKLGIFVRVKAGGGMGNSTVRKFIGNPELKDQNGISLLGKDSGTVLGKNWDQNGIETGTVLGQTDTKTVPGTPSNSSGNSVANSRDEEEDGNSFFGADQLAMFEGEALAVARILKSYDVDEGEPMRKLVGRLTKLANKAALAHPDLAKLQAVEIVRRLLAAAAAGGSKRGVRCPVGMMISKLNKDGDVKMLLLNIARGLEAERTQGEQRAAQEEAERPQREREREAAAQAEAAAKAEWNAKVDAIKKFSANLLAEVNADVGKVREVNEQLADLKIWLKENSITEDKVESDLATLCKRHNQPWEDGMRQSLETQEWKFLLCYQWVFGEVDE